jgi:hypothetical protein
MADRAASRPNLQQLVERHGGYHLIPPEAWSQYDAAIRTWNTTLRAGLGRHPSRPSDH